MSLKGQETAYFRELAIFNTKIFTLVNILVTLLFRRSINKNKN